MTTTIQKRVLLRLKPMFIRFFNIMEAGDNITYNVELQEWL